MSSQLELNEFQQRLQRLDWLLRETESQADAAARARLQELVQAILQLHAGGLDRLLEHIVEAGETGRHILDACARDEVVSGLLLLHGLHPLDLETRVEAALVEARPRLRTHGGNVELIAVSDGVVRLRLQGNCHHCPSSTVTMQQTIEEAIYGKAPEVTAIEVEGGAEESSRVSRDGSRVPLPVV